MNNSKKVGIYTRRVTGNKIIFRNTYDLELFLNMIEFKGRYLI